MFRTRFAAVILSGGLMLVSGCMQLPQGGLFGRRSCTSTPCCDNGCGCGCGPTVMNQAPMIISQDGFPSPTLPPPRIMTAPNITTAPSPTSPYTP